MDLNAIKQKLESMSKTTYNGGGNSNNRRFKPSVGKQTVRVVPFKYNKDFPFTEMKFYYGIGSRKVIASPLNWEEKDPIAEFAKQLRGTNDRENWRLAKKLDPKTRIFAPVIVRGEESDGVKMWEFGKEIYEAFLQMASDEEVGDFTDIMTGRDIKLNTVGPDVTGTPYNKTTISPSMKVTPLSDDSNSVSSWLENQQNPKETYKPLPYDDIKKSLQEWLTPEGEDNSDTKTSTDNKQESNFNLSNNQNKKTKVAKFDELFDDDSPF
jgi:hypothetical protein